MGGWARTAPGARGGGEYDMLMEPLDVSIKNWFIDDRIKPGDTRSMYADVEWTVCDDGLAVGYISDWYDVNRAAVKDITASFQAVQATLWRVPISLPDYDLDTGAPGALGACAVTRGKSSAAAEQTCRHSS